MELFSATVVLLNAMAVGNDFVAEFAIVWIIYLTMRR